MRFMVIEYSVIIPAYNEERTIERAIREIAGVFDDFGKPCEIIVVDDGSSDRTAEIVLRIAESAALVSLIRLTKNQGKGAAVRAGVERSTGEIILFLDADLATHPSEFKKFIPALQENDILIGSRTARGSVINSRQPFYRVLLGKLFNKLAVRWYLKLPYNDTQCGFKAFHKKIKPMFNDITSNGWAFDVEFLVRAKRENLRIAEIPVQWSHGHESRVRLRDAARVAKEIYRIKNQ